MTEQESVEQRLAELLAEDPGIWLVADETGTVRVSVGADGVLRTLVLAPSWWRRISPQELGPLVLSLRQASAAARQDTIAQLEEEGLSRTPADVPSVTPIPSHDADALDMSALRAELGNVLAAFSELSAYREAVRSATTESTVLQSPSGNASLELVGGSPRSLRIDPLNIQFVSEGQLAAEIVELFSRATHWFSERRAALLQDLPDLAAVVRSVRAAR